jgi:hypothetical protein
VGMHRRLSAMEDFIEKRVAERLESELKEMLTRLEHGLSQEEFYRVLEIVSREEHHGG